MAALLPVAKLAHANGHDVSFIAMTTARQVVLAAGLEPTGFAELMAFGEPNAEETGRRLVGKPNDGPVSHEESVAYHGISYAELIATHGEEEADRRYAAQGRQSFLPVDFFQRVLADRAPDVVIATSAPRGERAAMMAASQLGIPAVCVVDLFATAEIEWLKAPGFATRICVLSEAVRQRIVDAGRSPEEVVVTGNPAFDALSEGSYADEAGALRAACGWGDHFVIGWASQVEPAVHPFTGKKGDPDLPRRVENTLLDIVAEDDSLALFVRHHPSEQRELPAPSDRVRISDRSMSVELMLHACDAVVSIASTVGLQGALLGKPLITYDKSILCEGAPFSRLGISRGVDSLEGLGGAIDAVRTGREDFRPDIEPPGNSAQRVLDIAMGMTS